MEMKVANQLILKIQTLSGNDMLEKVSKMCIREQRRKCEGVMIIRHPWVMPISKIMESIIKEMGAFCRSHKPGNRAYSIEALILA